MKRLIPCMLLLPLLSSCVPEAGYYEPGYYAPPPPPPYVEIHRYEEHRHYDHGPRHHRHGYRPAPQARVHQAPANVHGNGNAHAHGSTRGGQAVVINPRQPQVRPQPQINAHTHPQVQVRPQPQVRPQTPPQVRPQGQINNPRPANHPSGAKVMVHPSTEEHQN
ncbi:hypothetical protein J2N86_05315 [Legionella lytica]|uniref:Lipoprotein n=1 Tax=Legionella lytica TaxID=96232 RepID=A0ABY4YAS4_9GAMM|nr:hypothetical protein [Legionella lytica]USQ14724.1 hypothetical protein J2N86_05315 [Legionella lytica]